MVVSFRAALVSGNSRRPLASFRKGDSDAGGDGIIRRACQTRVQGGDGGRRSTEPGDQCAAERGERGGKGRRGPVTRSVAAEAAEAA
eukprot:CAMPEP_0185208960 /NCGR_PEP_ID=MMETSP1140-20130426/62914_1 /TAXON_ID=298111 /ORGANISM="Pavlova sp., Strain CCMP459" /LENGTH=86 /DNA_ID=CAMNT_0027776707 /DNA_START=82 /DNA_END=339 /DNA_ORIENTATION=-